MNYLKLHRRNTPQRQVAQAAGIGVPDYSRYERGRSNPTPSQAKAICGFLGRTVGELWDREDWDYDLIDAPAPQERRRSGKGTGTCKLTVRLTAGLANRIAGQCKRMGLTQAGYLKYCADLVDGRDEDGTGPL